MKPIVAPLAVTFDGDASKRIVLDYWTKITTKSGQAQAVAAPPWNLWSGNQKTFQIWQKLRDEVRVLVTGASATHQCSSERLRNIFNLTRALTGRFGFDSTAAWNAQDIGFSPNDQNLAVESSPAIELLACVGLHRFKPCVQRRTVQYQHWQIPAQPAIAAALSCGAIPNQSTVYQFDIVKRGQYSAFGKAASLKENLSMSSENNFQEFKDLLKDDGPVAFILKQPLAPVDEEERIIFPPTYPITDWKGRVHTIRDGDYRVSVELPTGSKSDKDQKKEGYEPRKLDPLRL